MGHTCVVCGNKSKLDSEASFHRFPSALEKILTWLRTFGIEEHELQAQSRVCSRQFPDGDTKRDSSSLVLGKRFASPVKITEPVAKRAKSRDVSKELFTLSGSVPPAGRSSSGSITPAETATSPQKETLTASFGEQFDTKYTLQELPSGGSHACESPSSIIPLIKDKEDSMDYVVNAALLSKIELLEVENRRLKASACKVSPHFRIEQILTK